MIKVRTYLSEDIEILNALTKPNGSFSVFRDLAPEGEELPMVVWSITASSAMNNIDCAGVNDVYSLQFDVYASTQEGCDILAKKVRSAVNSFARSKGYINAPDLPGEYRKTFSAVLINEW